MRRSYTTIAATLAGLSAMVLSTAGLAVAAPTETVIVRAGSFEAAAGAITEHGGSVTGEVPLIGAVTAELTASKPAALQGHRDVEVGVALVDTGVAELPELAGRVVHGPDLSAEGDGLDRYGHGTFMAGLIAAAPNGDPAAPIGVAPGAYIVSVKVAGEDGAATLSRWMEAIGWVVVNQDDHGIRALNLSVAVTMPMAWQADPQSAAVQAAWSSGITVVAAAGNDGEGIVTSPGRDPWVLTVGASDPNGTTDVADDTVAEWSGRGRVGPVDKPDVLAPRGQHGVAACA